MTIIRLLLRWILPPYSLVDLLALWSLGCLIITFFTPVFRPLDPDNITNAELRILFPPLKSKELKKGPVNLKIMDDPN